LTARLHYREGVQFSYQSAIDLPGRSKPFFRADFVVFREYCNTGGFFPRGMVLDPYVPATHPHPARLVREAVLEGRDRSPLATMPGVTGNPIRPI
jgi:hypothetical protein